MTHVETSLRFVDALSSCSQMTNVVELGSGGGIPGFVVAAAISSCRLTCIESDERRVDHLWWAVHHLKLADRIVVIHARAEAAAHDDKLRGVFDACIARSFAPLPIAVEVACGFLRVGGHAFVSVPQDDRSVVIRAQPLETVGLKEVRDLDGLFHGIQQMLPRERYPRTEKQSRRHPLWHVSRETL